MDGSASPFVLLIQQAGLEEQAAPKRFMRVTRRVEVKQGDKWARLDPYEGFKLAFSIEFKHPVIERSTQSVTVDFAETSYLKEIARALFQDDERTSLSTRIHYRSGLRL